MHPPDGQGLNQNDLNQWWNYFPYGSGVSRNWRVVPDFYTYAKNRPVSYTIQTNDSGYTRRGDLMLMDGDNNGSLDHAKIISGNGWISPYSVDYSNRLPGFQDLSSTLSHELMTDGHTNDRWHVPLCFSYNCNYRTLYIRAVRTN